MHRDHRYRNNQTGKTWEPGILRFPGSRDRVIIHRLQRIADLLNGMFFRGEQIIKTENLLEKNPVIHKITQVDGKITAVENTLDISVKVILKNAEFLVMFQGQTHEHYAMPIRVLNERGTDYYNQWNTLKKKHRKRKDLTNGEELLSGIKRDDLFYPVIHIIIYFGEVPWTAAKKMEELFPMRNFPKEIRKYFKEKPLLIFSIHHFENPQWFHTDLRQVCEFLQRTRDKEQLKSYIKENQEIFSDLPEDTYNLLTVMSGSKQLKLIKQNVQTVKGGFDMCKALDDMVREGKLEGKLEGEDRMGKLIKKLISAGRINDLAVAADNYNYRKQLMVEFGIL